MFKCNTVYLFADHKGCNDCKNAALICMTYPFQTM